MGILKRGIRLLTFAYLGAVTLAIVGTLGYLLYPSDNDQSISLWFEVILPASAILGLFAGGVFDWLLARGSSMPVGGEVYWWSQLPLWKRVILLLYVGILVYVTLYVLYANIVG